MLSDTTNERPWLRPAIYVAIAVAVVAVVIAGVRGCTTHDQQTHPTTGAAEQGPDLTTPPEQVTWMPVGPGIQLPTSAVSGPTGTEAFAATGFEHSPQGAALAAIQNTVRVSVASDALWPETVRSAVAPGPGRDEFAVARAQLSTSPGGDPETTPAVRGYEITDYTDTNTTVLVYTSYPDDSRASTTVELIWRDDDWRIVMPDPETATKPPIAALSEFPASMIALEASQ